MSPEMGGFPAIDTPEGPEPEMAERLRRSAAALPYPATPDISARVRRRLSAQAAPGRRPRRLATVLAILSILVIAAMLVSPVRARVVEWIRIGAVRIFFFMPGPTPSPPVQSGTPPPQPTATFLRSVLDLVGEMSLADAQEKAGYAVRLPAHPPDLGPPDHVYLQQYDRPAVILVWMDEQQPGQVRMTLTLAPSDTFIFEKQVRRSVMDTRVNDQPAVWVEGDYPLVTRSGDIAMTRLITQGHTLIWTEGEFTFRLETDDDLETALRIAESLSDP